MLKRIITVLLVIYAVYMVYYPNRHAKRYTYITDEYVFDELLQENLTRQKFNLQSCTYNYTIIHNVEIEVSPNYQDYRFRKPQLGGEYIPACHPLFKTAILVPYKNRLEHLLLFTHYMHYFLQEQNIHYKIFIVEQNNSHPFNRAKLLNFGAREAMMQGFNCLILHDVDLLPLSLGNIYACSKKPRHMSSSIDTFRFHLPYLGLFGGVISISARQFKDINGMSNVYDGWGGEDDDLFTRLESANYLPYRFSPKISKYTMLIHVKQKPSEDRFRRLNSALQRQREDGLNTLPRNYVVKLNPLYTHLIT